MVNFTNILRAAFVLIFFCTNLKEQLLQQFSWTEKKILNFVTEKLIVWLSYEKAAQKMLVKLTFKNAKWLFSDHFFYLLVTFCEFVMIIKPSYIGQVSLA